MTIVHLDFTGTYNEEMNYQENLLPRANAANGHRVYFITTCYRWNNGVEEKTAAGEYLLDDGVRLIRLPYSRLGSEAAEKKLRAVSGLYGLLEKLSPDTIFLHCIQTAAVFPLVKYAKNNPSVVLYADTHTDFNNSAHGFISKNILHGILYRFFSRVLEPHVKKLFYITQECRSFIEAMYGFPGEKLEYLPLGGFLPTDGEYSEARQAIRARYNFSGSDIVFVHSGKLNAQKKTAQLISSFHRAHTAGQKLIIAGSMDPELEKKVMPVIEKDNSIIYSGWIAAAELQRLLCGADVYIQPGTQSATMQTAACCRCALALYPYESHKALFGDSVFYIENGDDIAKLLRSINSETVQRVRNSAFETAKEKIDYMKEAKRIEG